MLGLALGLQVNAFPSDNRTAQELELLILVLFMVEG